MKNKPEYWYKQSAVIPYKIVAGKLEVLMVTSRKKKKWIFPKGIIEPNLTPSESAQKEAEEEAGVRGDILEEKIGDYVYAKWGGDCSVQVYGQKVNHLFETWEEDFRLRKWINFDEISEFTKDKNLIRMVQKLRSILNL